METSFTPQEIINLTNQYRESKRLHPLKTNPILMRAAQERAKDMAKTGYFSHQVATTTPNVSWSTFIRKAGYTHPNIGENLARDFKDASSTLEAWKNSPLHNQNLLHSQYSDIGVSIMTVMKDGRQTYYVVQYFGKSPEAQRINVKPKATSTPQVSSTTPSSAAPPMKERTRTIPMP